MDLGLRARWPLSPLATALAAGALFALCVAVWKRSFRPKEDPRGRLRWKRTLDPKKRVADNGGEEQEKKKERLPVVKHQQPPRPTVGTHLLENIGAVLRGRKERGEHNFPSLPCSYQHCVSLSSDAPSLGAKLILDIHPYLSSYLQRFHYLKEISLPLLEKRDFEGRDVSINPEILKDKPITRAALSLELEKQLYRLLAPREDGDAAIAECGRKDLNVKLSSIFECDDKSESKEERPVDGADCLRDAADNAALWDSGYYEKSLDEHWNASRCPDDSVPSASESNARSFSETAFESKATVSGVDEKVNSGVGDTLSRFGTEFRGGNKISESAEVDFSGKNNLAEILRRNKAGEVDFLVSNEYQNTGQISKGASGGLESLHISDASVSAESVTQKALQTSASASANLESLQTNLASEVANARASTVISEDIDDILFQNDAIKDINGCKKDCESRENDGVLENVESSGVEANKEDLEDPDISDDSTSSETVIENEPRADTGEKIPAPPNMDELQSTSFSETAGNTAGSENIQENAGGVFQQDDACVCERSESESKTDESGFENAAVPETEDEADNLDLKNLNISISSEGKGTEAKTVEKIFPSTSVVDGNGAVFSEIEKTQKPAEGDRARARGVDTRDAEELEALQSGEKADLPRAPERESGAVGRDVIAKVASRDPEGSDVTEEFAARSQMDRGTQERSVAVESTVTTETSLRANGDLSVSVSTTVTEEVGEFAPLQCSEAIFRSREKRGGVAEEEARAETESSADSLLSSPRADRLRGLLSRDEQRRKKFQQYGAGDGDMEGEWDRLMRDVLASVSELERWERRRRDVSSPEEDAEEHPQSEHPSSAMEEEESSLSPTKGETPTKVKSLRFKLDPDIFDVPSDDSFYDDDQERGWRRQSKYKTFSSLDNGDEPVRLVSVQASVVPAGHKMVARPVEIDLRVRLTEERQSKRAHVSTSPSQAKRRSPVSDRGTGWCQELSPVTENVDWRENFTPVTPQAKTMLNGILKTPSPKSEPAPVESPNPFKTENGVGNGVVTNGTSPVIENKRVDRIKYNGLTWRPMERKPFSLPRKKFEPDPEAIERITGYKTALSKPPLPPPVFHRVTTSSIVRNRAEIARKQYLDNKAALAAAKVDNSKKFQQFVSQAQNDRARIVTSVPDLVAIERAVNEQWSRERASVSPRESPARESTPKAEENNFSRGSTPDDAWASYVQSYKRHLGRRSQSMTYLETDIDIIPVLDDDDKCRSTSALDEPDEALPDPDDSDLERSREDLDDSGRAKSEHELRIERSLRSLPLPDWYKRSEKPKSGFLLGSSNKEKRGWAAAKSLASSTSSLASCGVRRPVRSLRSSRENIPWSRSSPSPDGPTLSLALAKAFREPYLGWRARTPTSSGVSSSPHASPPSWNATTDDETNGGVSFDGEDAFGRTVSSDDDQLRTDDPISLDDTGADAVTVSMDTNEPVKLPGGEDTCDDINNMSMDTCEMFDASVPVDEDPSPQADTGDDIDNLSTDTATEARKLDPKFKRYSYSQSIYHSEWEAEEESRGEGKSKLEKGPPSSSSPDHKVVWIESSFVGSRTTTSIVVMPEDKNKNPGNSQERPASR